MYTVISRYQVFPGTSRQSMQRMRKTLLPVLSRMPGLKACYLVEVADQQVASISLFETRADAKAATQALADWITQQETALLADSSEAMSGVTTVVIEHPEERHFFQEPVPPHEQDLFHTFQA